MEVPMITKIVNHFRLTGRLLKDRRVKTWLKVALIALPTAYAVIPFSVEIPDFIPLVGLLDDLLLIGVCTLVFTLVCPVVLVREHRQAIDGTSPEGSVNLEIFRHPEEMSNLGLGLVVTTTAMLVTGLSVGLVWMMLMLAGYGFSLVQRSRLLGNAIECTEGQLPELHQVLQGAGDGLDPIQVSMFVTQNPIMNAYTFGFREPYTIVLTSALVEKLSPEEIRAVIGHELGHIHFNHVILINLMSISVTGLERMIFYKWSRSCEYTADAMALRASENDPKPMISALIKMASGLKDAPIHLDSFLEQVQNGKAEHSSENAEMLGTHPFINNRIRRLLELSQGTAGTGQMPIAIQYPGCESPV
jgi:Zn-dependent protease with chaperone function